MTSISLDVYTKVAMKKEQDINNIALAVNNIRDVMCEIQDLAPVLRANPKFNRSYRFWNTVELGPNCTHSYNNNNNETGETIKKCQHLFLVDQSLNFFVPTEIVEREYGFNNVFRLFDRYLGVINSRFTVRVYKCLQSIKQCYKAMVISAAIVAVPLMAIIAGANPDVNGFVLVGVIYGLHALISAISLIATYLNIDDDKLFVPIDEYVESLSTEPNLAHINHIAKHFTITRKILCDHVDELDKALLPTPEEA